MPGGDILLGIAVVVGALALGELVYRRQANTARLLGDVSQALYASFALLLVIVLVFAGGAWTFVAGALIVLYFAVARTKWSDVSEAGVRNRLQG